eukprot:g26855.t1
MDPTFPTCVVYLSRIFIALLLLYPVKGLEFAGRTWDTPYWKAGPAFPVETPDKLHGELVEEIENPCDAVSPEAKNKIVLVYRNYSGLCSHNVIARKAHGVGARAVLVADQNIQPSGLLETEQWGRLDPAIQVPVFGITKKDAKDLMSVYYAHTEKVQEGATAGKMKNASALEVYLQPSDRNAWDDFFVSTQWIWTFRVVVALGCGSLALMAIRFRLLLSRKQEARINQLAVFTLDVELIINLFRAVLFGITGYRGARGIYLSEWVRKLLYVLPQPWQWACVFAIALGWWEASRTLSVVEVRALAEAADRFCACCDPLKISRGEFLAAVCIVFLVDVTKVAGDIFHIHGRWRNFITTMYWSVLFSQLCLVIFFSWQGLLTYWRLRANTLNKNLDETTRLHTVHQLQTFSLLLLLTGLGLTLNLAGQYTISLRTFHNTLQGHYTTYTLLEVGNLLSNLGCILIFAPYSPPVVDNQGSSSTVRHLLLGTDVSHGDSDSPLAWPFRKDLTISSNSGTVGNSQVAIALPAVPLSLRPGQVHAAAAPYGPDMDGVEEGFYVAMPDRPENKLAAAEGKFVLRGTPLRAGGTRKATAAAHRKRPGGGGQVRYRDNSDDESWAEDERLFG